MRSADDRDQDGHERRCEQRDPEPVDAVWVTTAASPTTAAMTATACTTAPARDSAAVRSPAGAGRRAGAAAPGCSRRERDERPDQGRAQGGEHDRQPGWARARGRAPTEQQPCARTPQQRRRRLRPLLPTTVAITGSSRTASSRRRAGEPTQPGEAPLGRRGPVRSVRDDPLREPRTRSACSADTATITVAASLPSATRSTSASIRCSPTRPTDGTVRAEGAVPASATSCITAGTSSSRSPGRASGRTRRSRSSRSSVEPAEGGHQAGSPPPPLPKALPTPPTIRPTRVPVS